GTDRLWVAPRVHGKTPAIQLRHLAAPRQFGRYTLLGEQPRQLALHPLADAIAVPGREPVQHQLLDMHLDVRWRHTHPPISPSVSGRSNLADSARAARSRCAMPTGSPASAARKAAYSAMLRMLPPATFSRANFPTSSPRVGVWRGKMRRQISARCPASG